MPQSHLDELSFKKLSSVNLFTVDICASNVEVVEASVRISSACIKPPTYMLFTDAPIQRQRTWGAGGA